MICSARSFSGEWIPIAKVRVYSQGPLPYGRPRWVARAKAMSRGDHDASGRPPWVGGDHHGSGRPPWIGATTMDRGDHHGSGRPRWVGATTMGRGRPPWIGATTMDRGDHDGSPLPGVLLFVLLVEVGLFAAQDDATALDISVCERVGSHIECVAVRDEQCCILAYFECAAALVDA